MQTVWKINVSPCDSCMVSVPQGAEFLCVKEQKGRLMLWFRCDPMKPTVQRCIYMVDTGQWREDIQHAEYLDTIMTEDHRLVLHFFVEPETVQ